MSLSPGPESVTSIFGIGTELLLLRGGGHATELTSPLVIPFSLEINHLKIRHFNAERQVLANRGYEFSLVGKASSQVLISKASRARVLKAMA